MLFVSSLDENRLFCIFFLRQCLPSMKTDYPSILFQMLPFLFGLSWIIYKSFNRRQMCLKVLSHYSHINLDIYKHMYFLSVMLCQWFWGRVWKLQAHFFLRIAPNFPWILSHQTSKIRQPKSNMLLPRLNCKNSDLPSKSNLNQIQF